MVKAFHFWLVSLSLTVSCVVHTRARLRLLWYSGVLRCAAGETGIGGAVLVVCSRVRCGCGVDG